MYEGQIQMNTKKSEGKVSITTARLARLVAGAVAAFLSVCFFVVFCDH